MWAARATLCGIGRLWIAALAVSTLAVPLELKSGAAGTSEPTTPLQAETASAPSRPVGNERGPSRWLGVGVQDITPSIGQALGLAPEDRAGALVANVVPGSPAAMAGIRSGDVIMMVDDRQVDAAGDLPVLLASKSVGEKVNLIILRQKEKLTVAATIVAKPVTLNSAPAGNGLCVAGAICCIGSVCGTLEQFTHNAEIACLQPQAKENQTLPDSIRGTGECLAATIMANRVRGAIDAHNRSMQARRQLQDEIRAHPDIIEFRFRALLPKIENFNSKAVTVIHELDAIKNRYRVITARMADYADRQRQLGPSSDYRNALARSQISIILSQGSIATDQVHFRAQSLQNDFQTNAIPVGQQLADLEHLCNSFADTDQLQAGCKINGGLIAQFKRKFAELADQLAQAEAAYHVEQKNQQRFIDSSNRIP